MSYLELKYVSKLFGSLAALDGVSLQVQKGEILGIVGPNGSGKTTLINTISGYHAPTLGTISFEGKTISGLRPDKITRRGIARTFQSNILYEGATVLESMMISAYLQYQTNHWQSLLKTRAFRRDDEKAAGRVVDLLNLFDLQEHMMLPADGLSHGYQRLLGIAMALVANPNVLLLDEPTTGMSLAEAMFVVDKIKKIAKQGVTVILIEHNMKVLLGLATRVICMSFGTKLADGLPEEVMNQQEVIEAYLGTEMI